MNARRGSVSHGLRTSTSRGSPNTGLDGPLDLGLKPVQKTAAANHGMRLRVEDEAFSNAGIPAPTAVGGVSGLPSRATVPQTPPGRFMRTAFQSRGSKVPGRSQMPFSGGQSIWTDSAKPRTRQSRGLPSKESLQKRAGEKSVGRSFFSGPEDEIPRSPKSTSSPSADLFGPAAAERIPGSPPAGLSRVKTSTERPPGSPREGLIRASSPGRPNRSQHSTSSGAEVEASRSSMTNGSRKGMQRLSPMRNTNAEFIQSAPNVFASISPEDLAKSASRRKNLNSPPGSPARRRKEATKSGMSRVVSGENASEGSPFNGSTKWPSGSAMEDDMQEGEGRAESPGTRQALLRARRFSLSDDVSYRKRPGNSELGIRRQQRLISDDAVATDPTDFKSRSRIDSFDNDDMPRMSLEDKFATLKAGSANAAMSGPSFIHQVARNRKAISSSLIFGDTFRSGETLSGSRLATSSSEIGQGRSMQTRQLQSFEEAQEFAMANPPRMPDDTQDEGPVWGSLAAQAQGEDMSPPELTEAMREDLLFRLECAKDSGYLNLTYHLWPEIPEEVADFLKKKGHHLKALNFEGNQSRLIPDSFENMRMLVSLNLGGNQLPQVPNGVDSLRILTSLSLEKNKIKTLPDSLGKCTSLTYLDVSHNELNWLPDSLKNLKNLMTLKVASNRMCHLPEQICSMRGLKEINASNNMITGIPAEIGSLPKLELLRLDHNKLTALPESLGGLWRTIVELSAGHNPLTILPLSLGACKKIDTLDLASCPLVLPPQDIVLHGTKRVIEYLSSTGSTMLGGNSSQDPRFRGLKSGRSYRKSHKNLADMIAKIGQDLQKEESSADAGQTECGHCVKLYAEIAQWKTEIKQLAEEITDRDEELEELRRDNSEIRDTMLRKQNRLHETNEAVQTLVREKKESESLVERLQNELKGQQKATAASDAEETRALHNQVLDLEVKNKALQDQLDKSEANLVVAKDDLRFMKDQGSENDKALEELRAKLSKAEARTEKAEESGALVNEKSYSEALARIAELEKQLQNTRSARASCTDDPKARQVTNMVSIQL